LCAAVLVVIFLVSALPSAAVAQSEYAYNVKINRTVNVGPWGLVTVDDALTVYNNSTATLGDIPIGIPRNMTAGLKYLEAKDNQNVVLTIDRDLDPSTDVYWFKVSFARTLAYNESYGFTVTSLFTNVLVPHGDGYQYRFAIIPVLKVKGCTENMTIVAVSETEFTDSLVPGRVESGEEGAVRLVGYFAPIDAYAAWQVSLNVTSPNQHLVRVPSVIREVRFGEDGSIHVSETYTFENLGSSVSTISLTIPQNSTDVMAYDLFGPLWDLPRQGPSVSLSPRYSDGISTNRTFTFTLKYQVDPRTYVKQGELWGTDTYTSALLPEVKYWVVDKLEATVIVPNGFNIKSTSPIPLATSSSLYDRTLRYETTDATPYADLELNIQYSYAPFWSGSMLLVWTALIELVAVIAIVVARTRRPAPSGIPVPSEQLKEFVELYDGRNALRLELDRMAQDLTRGALNKHEYRRRRRTIELRMDELDRALQPLRQDLKAFHPRYNEIFLKMEKAEGEIDANRLGEEHFRTQYRSGKISKEAYDRAIEDIERRIEKAREVIDTSLVTLREEAR